jgi:hypothetical protein
VSPVLRSEAFQPDATRRANRSSSPKSRVTKEKQPASKSSTASRATDNVGQVPEAATNAVRGTRNEIRVRAPREARAFRSGGRPPRPVARPQADPPSAPVTPSPPPPAASPPPALPAPPVSAPPQAPEAPVASAAPAPPLASSPPTAAPVSAPRVPATGAATPVRGSRTDPDPPRRPNSAEDDDFDDNDDRCESEDEIADDDAHEFGDHEPDGWGVEDGLRYGDDEGWADRDSGDPWGDEGDEGDD